MKSPYEQRRELSIHTQHFGEASSKARFLYGVVLIIFSLIIIVSSQINGGFNYINVSEMPDQVEVAKQAFASQYSSTIEN
ncbi:MAG: hypothetical protein AAF223_23305 [Bacteroidota bacterium]